MTPKNVAAAEMQSLIEQLQGLIARGERLAQSSRLVDPRWFRGAQTMATMAAGDLDEKGLLTTNPAPIAKPLEPA